MSGNVGRSSRQGLGGDPVAGRLNSPDLDIDEVATAELVAVRREIRKDLDGLPDYATRDRSAHESDLAAIDAVLQDRISALEGVLYWDQKVSEDKLAANLASEIAQVRSDEDVWKVATAVSKHFREGVAVPEPEPIELSELVPDVDPNNAFSGFRDARIAAKAANPNAYMREQTATHDDPLRQRAAPEPAKRMTTSADGDELRERTKKQMIADGLLKQFQR